MKFDALQHLRSKLSSGHPTYGLWVTLESATITEIAVGLDLDWIVVDAEHGHLDWGDILEHIRATLRSRTVVLVRLAENNPALIKRALDIGADGVVIPWIETAHDLREAIASAKYPPAGRRGIGAERATGWGQCLSEYVSNANEQILIVPLIETFNGIQNLPAILNVPGVEIVFFGPADLSASTGYAGQWEGPGVAESILSALSKVRAAGKFGGVVAAGDADLSERRSQGFQMLGLGLDAGLLIRELRRTLSSQGQERMLSRGGFPDKGSNAPPLFLEIIPEKYRPDRPEVMCTVGDGKHFAIEQGVDFECLVGAHNEAKNLTVGIVSFTPGSRLPSHRHHFVESITVIEGRLSVDVADRRYLLDPLDNITIPAGVPHRAMASEGFCRAHIAMCTDDPRRELLSEPATLHTMPNGVSGLVGPEHIVRFSGAPRYAAGPNTQFINYFNAKIIPNCPMSGGYGRFAHAGRLPAHIHDFDESITIVEGRATCNVEGRSYLMSDLSTALQPRGRIHYFINETHSPMAMIWVYAGPLPERIELAERFTFEGADPWKEKGNWTQ